MGDRLTKDDRSNSVRCGERFAHGMFNGPTKQPWVRDGKMTGVTGNVRQFGWARVVRNAESSAPDEERREDDGETEDRETEDRTTCAQV
jgi:hypothetical protein